ncbi:hypothetical protein [Brevundimonas sp.]|uniref:hypothetical protein n=1 Tax=Brevundimonas sp. TaxID=1871086 RepID=UPI002737ABD1|nr:hypothetical protein [Brevundimonas sp.]MDP3802729.1 hypothetical protein [Brevundimonas sp.]
MGEKRFPWKGNFRIVPPKVRVELAKIDSELVAIAAVKSVHIADVQSGLYAHLGLDIDLLDGSVITDGPKQPPADAGKWSYRNERGWDRKRPDLPMVPKSYVFETPNFGDAATYGTHMHVMTRDVYQHQVFEPQGMEIEPTILSQTTADNVLVKFALAPMLSRGQPEFELMLLWALNVLQENTGVTGVFPSTATKEDFLGTIQLDWDIFPPGTIDDVVAWFTSKPSAASRAPDFDKHLRDRTAAFNKLQPEAYIRGSGQFGSYFGAKFADDLVVFENLRYGNALYVLYDDWNDISKRSRLDLLRDHDAKFDRIIHTDDWQFRFRELIRRELAARRRGRGRH